MFRYWRNVNTSFIAKLFHVTLCGENVTTFQLFQQDYFYFLFYFTNLSRTAYERIKKSISVLCCNDGKIDTNWSIIIGNYLLKLFIKISVIFFSIFYDCKLWAGIFGVIFCGNFISTQKNKKKNNKTTKRVILNVQFNNVKWFHDNPNGSHSALFYVSQQFIASGYFLVDLYKKLTCYNVSICLFRSVVAKCT